MRYYPPSRRRPAEARPPDRTAPPRGGGRLLPDPAAIRRLGAERCARLRLVPLRPAGALTPVGTSSPEAFDRHRAFLETALGSVAPVHLSADDLDEALTRYAGLPLARGAETRCPEDRSCRHLTADAVTPRALALLLIGPLAILLAPAPALVLACLLGLAVALVNAVLLAVALWPRRPRPLPQRPVSVAQLPVVSLLLPLHREADIASILIERIARIDYPRDRLDVCLVVEARDALTAGSLANTRLPSWVRVIRVAPGAVQTKPRAMNVALDFCRGDVVGIYDAEDAPAPDQIIRVVEAFARSGPRLACLQGRLSFYNARANWLTRCFAMDYATWFWLVLPALRRMGWPVPLGGTTVFFRRATLEEVGGWDAHNVTEDADLGIRLARAGYVTDLVDAVTLEEATSTPGAWIRQRSRWQKGYAITWASHMRAPRRLLRDLGPWGFIGVQVLFLGSLLGAFTAPALWSLWLLLLGLPHPLGAALGGAGMFALGGVLTALLMLNVAATITALRRQDRLHLAPWIPFLQLYHPLATISLVKALAELVVCPFFWDKTQHGVSPPDTSVTAAPRRE